MAFAEKSAANVSPPELTAPVVRHIQWAIDYWATRGQNTTSYRSSGEIPGIETPLEHWAPELKIPSSEAYTLASWALGVGVRADALLFAPATFTPSQRETYLAAVKARADGTPLQHILGEMWFFELTLTARPGVFITRPETETVVEIGEKLLSETAPNTGHEYRIIDLCTGSGAIALALATHLGKAQVWAVEKSPLAAETARENLERYPELAAKVQIITGDATDINLPLYQELTGKLDLVITNPPYVPPGEVQQQEALADPAAALWGGGPDGLAVPLALLPVGKKLLHSGGWFVMEHAEKQASKLVQVAQETGWQSVGTGKDLTGKPRCLIAQKP